MALGPMLVGSASVTHRHARVERCRWGSNDKNRGESHLPPSAAMARSGWRSSCITVTTLLGTKMEFTGARHKSRQTELLEIGWWREEIR